jgi:hypothetical protein
MIFIVVAFVTIGYSMIDLNYKAQLSIAFNVLAFITILYGFLEADAGTYFIPKTDYFLPFYWCLICFGLWFNVISFLSPLLHITFYSLILNVYAAIWAFRVVGHVEMHVYTYTFKGYSSKLLLLYPILFFILIAALEFTIDERSSETFWDWNIYSPFELLQLFHENYVDVYEPL